MQLCLSVCPSVSDAARGSLSDLRGMRVSPAGLGGVSSVGLAALTWISSPDSPGSTSECRMRLSGTSGPSQSVTAAKWKSIRIQRVGRTF